MRSNHLPLGHVAQNEQLRFAILSYPRKARSARDEGKRACFYEVARAWERASSEVACACERASWAAPEAHEMNRCVLRDIDVAPRMQACTGWLGGGSNQNTRRQERDPSSDLAETKKPDTLVRGTGLFVVPLV